MTTNELMTGRQNIDDVVAQIEILPSDWHGVGTMTPKALRAIARHGARLGSIKHSVETGSGKTTLLFSHLSENHLVFALDEGSSMTRPRTSSLLNRESVTFVDGLTQETLPRHHFDHPLQLALIDGPHGYPFPDLEFFYLFPLIETGGLLLVDDIKIPSIHRMFQIIAADETFRLLEVVDDNLAFFERTNARAASMTSDGWWQQGYNRAYYDEMLRPPPDIWKSGRYLSLRRFYNSLSQYMPSWVKGMVPRSLRDRVWKSIQA